MRERRKRELKTSPGIYDGSANKRWTGRKRNETNTRLRVHRALHAQFEKIRKQTAEKAIASSGRSFLRVIRTPRPKGVNYQAVLDPGGVAEEVSERWAERGSLKLYESGSDEEGVARPGPPPLGKDGDSRVRDNVFNYLQDVT